MVSAVKTKQYPVKKSSHSSTLMPPGAKELKQSSKRLEALMDEAPIGICHTDLASKFTYVNRRFEEVSGYSREEMVGKSGFKLGMFSSQTLKLLGERMKDRLAGRPSRVLELQFKCKDGHQIWVAMEGQLIRERGIPVGFQLISSDITERKQATEALLESEERSRSIVENSLDGIMILDDAYRLIYVNDELCRISGYSRDEIIGQDFRKFLDEESKKLVADRYIRRQRGEEVPPRYEFNFVRKDGEKRRVEISSSVIKDSAGKVKTVAQILDITGRRQAEEALQAEKNKLQSIIDAMEDALSIRDKDYNLIYQNEPVRRIFGDHLGEKCYRAYEGRDKVCDRCPVEKAFRDGKSHTSERKLVMPSGEVTFFENTANPIRDASGRIVSCLEIGRNITKRKQAEEELQTERNKLQSVIDAMGDSLTIQDKDYNIIYQNEPERISFGDHLGEKCYRVYEGREEICDRCPVEKASRDGKSHTSERRLVMPSGEVAFFETTANPIRDARGRIVSCIEIARNITQRKQGEEALRESEERYRALFENAYDMIQSVAPDGHLIFVNKAWLETLGYTQAELPTLNLFDIIHPESLPHCQEIFSKVISGESVRNVQATFVTKDGRAIQVEGNATARIIGGRVVATQGIFHDITERKRAGEELKLRAQILDDATDSIFVHDFDGNFIYVNEAACRAHGYSREELMKMKLHQVIAPERVSRLDSDFQEMLKKDQVVFESAHLRKDGSIMPAEVHGRNIESGGRKLLLTVIRDLTERKRAEEEKRGLEARAQLTSRLASVGEMAAGIAHEINNPLTAVIGFAQLLMDANIPDDVKKDIAVIYKEAQRAAEVAKSLLVFARKREPAREVTDLNHAIEEVLKLRAYEQRVTNIQVNTRFDPELPTVIADYSQLQQVFLNIIINAEAAMLEAHNGGILTVTTNKVNSIVRVSFTDNGPGIAKENLERVFDPFFTTKEVGKGTGLGLSVCHGIVVQHGGRIYARSRLGKGATFVVELPINAH